MWRSPFDLFRRLSAPERVTLRFRDSVVDETTQHATRLEALQAVDEYLKKASGRKTIIVELE